MDDFGGFRKRIAAIIQADRSMIEAESLYVPGRYERARRLVGGVVWLLLFILLALLLSQTCVPRQVEAQGGIGVLDCLPPVAGVVDALHSGRTVDVAALSNMSGGTFWHNGTLAWGNRSYTLAHWLYIDYQPGDAVMDASMMIWREITPDGLGRAYVLTLPSDQLTGVVHCCSAVVVDADQYMGVFDGH